MIELDDELAQEYLRESCKHTATIKADLLALRDGGSEIDERLVNSALRAVHSIKGGAFFGLAVIRNLAQQMEDVLTLMRYRKMVPTIHRVLVLFDANNRLHELLQNPRRSNQTDITEIMTDLARLCADHRAVTGRSRDAAVKAGAPEQRRLRSLLAEDDCASQLVLQGCLSRFGECDVAANGREAVEAFRSALEGGRRYDLVCMDIMMPEMNGREAVRQIRAMEETPGALLSPRAKIIMTTAVNDAEEVFRCFQESCDAYLVKPIDLDRLRRQLKAYHLIE